MQTAHDFGKRVAVHARAAESVKRSVRAGADCIYHCDFADEEALDMLEAVKDKVIVGPAFGLVHNSVFEGDVVGLTKEVAERMGLPRKLEFTVATYQGDAQARHARGGRRRLRFHRHADGPERARHRAFREVLRLYARPRRSNARPPSAAI